MKLKEGIYENLITDRLSGDISQTEDAGFVCQTEDIDSAESAKMLADFLADTIRKKLEDKDVPVEEKIELTNQILESADVEDEDMLVEAPRLLSAVISSQKNAELRATDKTLVRPLSGFRVSRDCRLALKSCAILRRLTKYASSFPSFVCRE